jgi:8-oxo-dGTP pyrophosphatase MutT (NUDIX family)
MKTNHNSYGIIPIYKKENEIFICAIQNNKSNQWGLPKGTPENLETPFETAKRELEEETGISEFEIIGGGTFSEKYSFEQGDVKHNKENTYYIASVSEMIDKNTDIDSKDMKWVNLNEANGLFKFDSIKLILSEISEYLMKFPLTNEYHGRSGEDYLFEYYEADSIDHLPPELLSQVQITAFHKKKLLIVNNANKFNTYGPVGGGIEKGETPEECLPRELQEESNMRVIESRLIGYQKCSNLSNPEKPIEYQLRYFATVEPIGEFTPDCDPDGDVTELLEIDPKNYKKYFDWGETGDAIMDRALGFLRILK